MGCNPNIFSLRLLGYMFFYISHSECYPREIPHEIPCFSLPGQIIPWPEPHAMQHLSSQIWGGRFLWIQVFLYGSNSKIWECDGDINGYDFYIYIIIYILYMYIYIYICIRLYDFMYMYGNLNVENDDQPSNWGTPDLPTKKIVTISISLAQEHECITSITIKLAGILQLVLVFMQRMQFGIFRWFSVCFILPVPRCGLAVKIFWSESKKGILQIVGKMMNHGIGWDWMGLGDTPSIQPSSGIQRLLFVSNLYLQQLMASWGSGTASISPQLTYIPTLYLTGLKGILIIDLTYQMFWHLIRHIIHIYIIINIYIYMHAHLTQIPTCYASQFDRDWAKSWMFGSPSPCRYTSSTLQEHYLAFKHRAFVINDTIWLWLTVCHGKMHHAINRYTQVNHLFLWAMASMAMLVIIRGYTQNDILSDMLTSYLTLYITVYLTDYLCISDIPSGNLT